jgi:hypothetical protein
MPIEPIRASIAIGIAVILFGLIGVYLPLALF